MPKREDIYKVGEYSDPESAAPPPRALSHPAGRHHRRRRARPHGQRRLRRHDARPTSRAAAASARSSTAASATSRRPRSSASASGCKGVTPNFHTQTDLFPYAVNVPIASARPRHARRHHRRRRRRRGRRADYAAPRSWSRSASDARGVGGLLAHAPAARADDLRKYYPLSEEAGRSSRPGKRSRRRRRRSRDSPHPYPSPARRERGS